MTVYPFYVIKMCKYTFIVLTITIHETGEASFL